MGGSLEASIAMTPVNAWFKTSSLTEYMTDPSCLYYDCLSLPLESAVYGITCHVYMCINLSLMYV